LTGGGPGVPGYKAGETDLLVTWLYKLTIDESEYNIGSVIAILTFIITASATLISYRRSKSFKEEDAFQ
jgi:arabinogalactan oligomer/maltooligosaccharide transport system permease protein